MSTLEYDPARRSNVRDAGTVLLGATLRRHPPQPVHGRRSGGIRKAEGAAGDIVMPAELLDGETEELHRVARRGRGQVVHRDPVAGLERGRHLHLIDVREEGGAVHGAEEPRGSFHSACARGNDHGLQCPWNIGAPCRFGARGRNRESRRQEPPCRQAVSRLLPIRPMPSAWVPAGPPSGSRSKSRKACPVKPAHPGRPGLPVRRRLAPCGNRSPS